VSPGVCWLVQFHEDPVGQPAEDTADSLDLLPVIVGGVGGLPIFLLGLLENLSSQKGAYLHLPLFLRLLFVIKFVFAALFDSFEKGVAVGGLFTVVPVELGFIGPM
jgi:hypothetical protein